MTVKDAVVRRFEELLSARGMAPNELANRAGVTPSTVYSMLDARRRDLSIIMRAMVLSSGWIVMMPDSAMPSMDKIAFLT